MKKTYLLLLFIHSYLLVFSTPDSWLQKSPLPAQPRIGAVAFALDGFGYCGTGMDSGGNLLNDFWKYDPVNDAWSQAATFAGTPRRNAVAFSTDSFAFVGTGFDSTGLTQDFYRYDAVNNTWQQAEDLDSAGAVYPRRDAAAFSGGNKGYVVGGYDGTTFYSKETWEYDANRDTAWRSKTVFPLAGRRWATAFAINGFGYVGLGFNYSQEYFNDFWKFDLATNAWTQVADFTGSDRGNASSFVLDGFAFVGTGFDGSLQNDFYVYDPLYNSWGPVASFGGNPLSSAAGFSVNGRGYVVGGVDTMGYKNELWEYTPATTLSVHAGNEEGNKTMVSPNPAGEWIVFTGLNYSLNNAFDLKLFDSSGRLVLNQILSGEEKNIFVKDLPGGIYYFSVNSSGSASPVTGKLILQ